VRGITDPDPRKADVALGAIRGWESIEPQDQMPGAASSKQTAPSGTTGAAAPAAPATKPTSQDAGTTGTVPAVERPATTPALSPLAPLTQRGLYTLTLLADRARIPFPVEIAWAVAGVQLVGGACVVLGLFSRVWGLLMSVILAALFVTTSLPVIKAQGPFSLGAEQQNLVLAQLGLFVLALGAFLVGPGAMSLDRAIFRRSRRTSAKGKSKSA
jgi:uncharacterized membrane protein YphA (DoxX/SURF4 family)